MTSIACLECGSKLTSWFCRRLWFSGFGNPALVLGWRFGNRHPVLRDRSEIGTQFWTLNTQHSTFNTQPSTLSGFSGFICGNSRTSRTLTSSQNTITSRSTPIPCGLNGRFGAANPISCGFPFGVDNEGGAHLDGDDTGTPCPQTGALRHKGRARSIERRLGGPGRFEPW